MLNSIIQKIQSHPIYPLRQRINELKRNLRDTDYKAIKYAEGETSAEEYEPTKILRKEWRAEINSLEKQIAELKS